MTNFNLRLAGAFLLAALCAAAYADRDDRDLTITYQPCSSVKVEQITGDHDWEVSYKGGFLPTASLTTTRADVLANGLGYSFEHDGKLIIFFGDTSGSSAEFYPTYTNFINDYHWKAHDPIAISETRSGEAPLIIDFLKRPDGTTLYVDPFYPDGTEVDMQADNIPNAGISLFGQIYLVCSTNSNVGAQFPFITDYSFLTTYNPNTQAFTAGRTISSTPLGGHFVFTSLHAYSTDCGSDEDSVLIFGEGNFRQSNIYLSVTPKRSFWSGQGTRYFAGYDHDRPKWSNHEADSTPIVIDNPLGSNPADPPTVGNLSVTYCKELKMWLMTYDGGRQSDATQGEYFAYAKNPWGPWSKPQLMFNPTRDNGFGNFIYFYDRHSGLGNGPAGPTANLVNLPPTSTKGGDFAPCMIERFTKVDHDTLTIYYTMSTWNPYTVVKMRSEFHIDRRDRD